MWGRHRSEVDRRLAVVAGLCFATLVVLRAPVVQAWTPTDINAVLNQSSTTWRINDMDLGPDGIIVSVGDSQTFGDFDPSPSVTRNIFPLSGLNDGFVQVLDRYGNYRWAARFADETDGGRRLTSANAVSVSANGDIYIAGYFGGSVDFDPSASGQQIPPRTTATFVVSLTSTGQFRWLNVLPLGLSHNAIHVDDSGSVTLVGSVSSTPTSFTFDFDPSDEGGRGVKTANNAFARTDMFVARYSAATGAYEWAAIYGSDDYDTALAVTADSQSNVIVTGYFGDTVDFDSVGPGGSVTADVAGPTNVLARDGFVLKLSPEGVYQWVHEVGAQYGSGEVRGVVVGANDDIHVVGQSDGITYFSSTRGVGEFTASGGNDPYVASLTSSGAFRWVRHFGPGAGGYNEGNAIDVDADGRIVAVGQFSGTVLMNPGGSGAPVELTAADRGAFFVRFESDGTFVHARKLGGVAMFDTMHDVVADGRGNVYAAGWHENSTNLDTDGGTATFSRDGAETYIARFDSDGSTRTKAPRSPVASATASVGGNIHVSWTEPRDDGGSPVTEYLVTAQPSGATCPATAPTRTCVLSGVETGEEQSITVVAVNAKGSSTPSAAVLATVPGLPRKPTLVTGDPGNRRVAVAWTAPTNTGGSPITRYRVTADPGGAVCETDGGTQCTVSGLTNGREYTFTVVATTVRGDSVPSDPSGPVTPFAVPSSPFDVVATAGNASAVVEWEPSVDGGGGDVTSYTVTASPGGETCIARAPAVICTVRNLKNGTSYTFTVIGSTRFGSSAPSDPSEPVTPFSVPGAPFGVVARAADSSAVVSWREPGENGGADITSYLAVASPGGRSCTVNATTSTCTIDGLTNGKSYRVTVTATNRHGESAGGSSDDVVPGRVPGPPRGLKAENDDGTLRLTWSHPEDLGGRMLTRYQLEVVRDGGDPTYRAIIARSWVNILDPAEVVPAFVVSGLREGSNYQFRLRGENSFGDGAWSDAASALLIVPQRTKFSMPADAPPLSYVSFDVPDFDLEWLAVSSRSNACGTHQRNKWWQQTRTDSVAVLFLRPGRCLVQTYRRTGSVDAAVVDTFVVEITRDAPRSRQLRSMLAVTMKFKDGGGPRGVELMSGSQEAVDNATPAWAYRPMYGPVHLFCDEGAFVVPARDTDATRLAKRRCGAASRAVSSANNAPLNFESRESYFVDEPDEARMVVAAVAPVVDPPSAPENVRIVADNYAAVVTWDPPIETYGASSVSYRLTYRINKDEPVTVVSTQQRRHEITVSKRTQVDIGEPVLVSIVAISAQGGRGAAALTEFVFKHRRTVASIGATRVRTGTWMKVVERVGSPAASLYVRSLTSGVVTCLDVRQTYVVFLAPGRCEVNVNQADPNGWMQSVDSRVVTISDSAVIGNEIPWEDYRVEFASDGITIADEAALREVTRDVIGVHLYWPAECQIWRQRPICRRTIALESFLQRLPSRRGLIVSTPAEAWNPPGGNAVVLHILRSDN